MADRQSKLDEKRKKISGLVGGLSSPKDDTVRSKVFEIRQILQDIEKIVPDPDVIYDWDQYFMSIACLTALRSEDQSVPVGACIVNSDKRIVGIGYNSMPDTKGCDDNGGKVFPWTGKSGKPFEETRYDYDKKLLYVVHAVVNAIINRTIPSLEGCTIYVTLKPDRDCAHAIIQAGISTVKYGSFIKPGREAKPDITGATKLLDQGEVNIIKYVVPKEPAAYIYSDKKITTISLSKRMKIKQKDPDRLRGEQFFMAVAMLSKKKQGRHGRRPQSTQGACIVSKDKKVISIGYSGYPEEMNYRAVNEETDMDYYAGDPYICHAEYDAILSRGTPSVKGCTLYVTKYPCNDCAKVIVQSGIKEVIYVQDNDTPQDGRQPNTLKELIEETDPKEKTKMKKHNMYLSSKRILTECHLVPFQAVEVILHDPGDIVEIFCATDQNQKFDVPRDGIKIVVPPFAKPNKIKIGVQLFPSGPFLLPANCQPISCFFQIQVSPKFNEPIKVHLEHHAELLSEDDSKELGFIICSEPSLPYKFQLADYKAITSFKENYGVCIQVPKFSIIAITTSLEFINNLRYVWMVYYKEIETSMWELDIVVTKDLRPFKQRIKDVYSDSDWIEYIEPKKFQFGEDNYIQYNKVEKRWKVFSEVKPCQINKSDVDKSTPDSALQHFQLYIKSDGSEDSAEQPCAPLVTLHGMKTESVFFKFLPTKVSYASKYEQFDKTYGMPDIQVIMSFGIIEKVHKSYICAQFSKVLDKWEAIGHMLGVPNSDLAIIKRDYPACESRCEEMFRKWLQSCSTSCKWKTILAALALVGEDALAEEIVPNLSFP